MPYHRLLTFFYQLVLPLSIVLLTGCSWSVKPDYDNKQQLIAQYNRAIDLSLNPRQQTAALKIFTGLVNNNFLPANVGAAKIKASRGDFQEALDLLNTAATQGYAAAQYLLANYYWYGIANALTVDHDKAKLLLTQAAADNYIPAVKQLADLVQTENQQSAMRLYHLAAEQGLASASTKLAAFYSQQNKDQAKAFYYTKLAAEQGVAAMQYQLAQYYLAGAGTQADAIAAYAWLSLALSNGVAAAEVEKKALDAILDAKQLATAWDLSQYFYQTYKVVYNDTIALQHFDYLYALNYRSLAKKHE